MRRDRGTTTGVSVVGRQGIRGLSTLSNGFLFRIALVFLVSIGALVYAGREQYALVTATVALRDSLVVTAAAAGYLWVRERHPRVGLVVRQVFTSLAALFLAMLLVTWASESVYSTAFNFDPQSTWFDFWGWLRGSLLHLNLGSSAASLNTYSVDRLLAQRGPVTLELALLSTAISTLIAVPGALISALRPQGRVDRFVTAVSSLAGSQPVFVSAVFIVLLFAVRLRWVPSQGWVPIQVSIWGNLRTALMPVTTLALTMFPQLLRVLRGDLIEYMDSDFVLAAQSRGQPDWYVVVRHALRPALASFITMEGIVFGQVIGGVVLVEYWFTIPGLGLSLWDSLEAGTADPLVLRGIATVVAIVYIVVNLLVDAAYRILDPRVRWS